MPVNNPFWDLTPDNNPLTTSLYNLRSEDSNVPPGESKLIITENGLDITTESGDFLITES